MPKKDIIVNLPGMRVKNITGYDPMIIRVNYSQKVKCIHCLSKKIRKKDKFERLIKHSNIGLRKVMLSFTSYKYQCKKSLRYFNQRFPRIEKYRTSSETLRKEIFALHNQGVSRKDLAKLVGVSTSTIERCYHELYKSENKEFSSRLVSSVLGIDELIL